MTTPRTQVLLVDDDEDLREAVAFVLEHAGYSVSVARNGREALVQLRDGLRPAMIILDLMMPVMDGWAFRREQQADAALAMIPVLVYSAMPPDQPIHADAMLSKAADLEDLIAAVKRLAP